MAASIRIELPPDVEDTPDVRARLVRGVAEHLGVDMHACAHDDLEKSERAEPRRSPHVVVQAAVERSCVLYRAQMARMVEEIAAALSE